MIWGMAQAIGGAFADLNTGSTSPRPILAEEGRAV